MLIEHVTISQQNQITSIFIIHMFIVNKLKDLLNQTKKKFQNWGGKKEVRKIVIAGLGNVGKRTLLWRLSADKKQQQTEPQLMDMCGFQQLWIGNIKLVTLELGKHQRTRKVWKNQHANPSGIVFMMDSSYPETFEENKAELDLILNQESLSHIPIAILANKIDKKTSASKEQITDKFQIRISKQNQRPLNLFMGSILKKTGYEEALEWIQQYLD